MTDKLPSCCRFHGYSEDGCNGRGCPAGRFDIAAAWRYLCGYVGITPPKDQITLAELLDTPPLSLTQILLARFVLGVVSVAIVIAFLGWLAYTLWPLIVAYFNN